MSEQWRPVVGFELLYEVSNLGNVRSLRRITSKGPRGGKVLKPVLAAGYPRFALSCESVVTFKRAHELVLEAFRGPRPLGAWARHFPDRDPLNNRLSNLSWASVSVNMLDKRAHGTMPVGATHWTRRGRKNG